MSDASALNGAVQESILTLICFDSAHAPFLRAVVDIDLFDTAVYRTIARAAYSYIDQYKEPPANHLEELLYDKLYDNSKERESQLYADSLKYLHNTKDNVNAEYVLNQVREFIRQQTLKEGIVQAIDHINDGNIEQAESAVLEAVAKRIEVFDSGTWLTDTSRSLSFLQRAEEALPTGIPELDNLNIGPQRKAMMCLIAPAKRGKSFWLVHLGKRALLERYKVAHITLEMPEWQVSQRYMQALFSISKQETRLIRSTFSRDEHRVVLEINEEEMGKRPSLQDDNIEAVLREKIAKFQYRLPLVIKEFPTGTLTQNKLNAYLDALERSHNFIPDLVCLDYPDLMKIDSNNHRLETGAVFKDLRGMAGERNVALAVVTQSNRGGAGQKTVTDVDVGEDWSKIATSDMILTHSQTPSEKELGLARLFVSNARDAPDKFSVLISQNYALGQFCLDSALIRDNYWDILATSASDTDHDDGEDA